MAMFWGQVALADASVPAGRRPGLAPDARTTRTVFCGSALFSLDDPVEGRPGPRGCLLDDGRTLSVALARLDNRTELAALLSIPPAELSQHSDGALLLALYRRRGDAGVARCVGSFAFASWDRQESRLTLGRDCLGQQALFFHQANGICSFATDLRSLLTLPGVPCRLDEPTMASWIVLHLGDPRRTLYQGVERVPGRSMVAIDHRGARHRHYWSPALEGQRQYRRDEDYVERARELLDQAVAAATADTPRVAISASGGLDSSALVSTVARLGRAESIRCLSLVPPPGLTYPIGARQYFDEREKIAALQRMHPGIEVEWCVEGAVHPLESEPERFFDALAQPVRNPCNIGPFAAIPERAAAGGHAVCLVGALGNAGLTWPGPYSLLALARAGRLPSLLHEVRALEQGGRRGVWRGLLKDAVWASLSFALRSRFAAYRGRGAEHIARYSLLQPSLIAELGLERRWREQSFGLWFNDSHWNPARLRAHRLFEDNAFGRDAGGSWSRLHGIERRDPLGDRRLLEFLLTVPEPLYRRDGVERSFARAVLADRVPQEILRERRRGYQGATWFQRLDARRTQVAEDIELAATSPLARRFIDLPALRRIFADWPADAAEAQGRALELRVGFLRALHVTRFLRWFEAGGASRPRQA